MKLYRIERKLHIVSHKDGTVDFEVGAVVGWRGTQADARTLRIELEKPLMEIKPAKRPKVVVEEVDVPTGKVELLKWLNENCV